MHKSDTPRNSWWLLGLLGVLAFTRVRSKFSMPLQQPIDSVNPKTHGRDENNSANNFMPLAPKIPPSNANSVNSCECCHHKSPWWKILLDVLTFLAAATAAGAAIHYAKISNGMWYQMQIQTGIAKDQLEQSERPWIEILDVKPRGNTTPIGGLSFQKIGPYKSEPDIRVQANIQVEVTFRNIGHSVADVSPDAELFMPQFSPSEYWNRINAEEQHFCGSREMKQPQQTVFPNENQPSIWDSGLSSPIRPENISHVPDGTGITPALIVCVSYRHKGLPSLYQTRAVYDISRLGSGTRIFEPGKCDLQIVAGNPNFIFCEGEVPAELLKFDRNTMGDDAY
jgi:hypothetical protein